MERRPSPGPHRHREAGYSLVVLAVAVTVMTALLAAALPYWSRAIQREKEEELIARGLQYAEAIRVFRNRFGRLPLRLEELIEVEPRSIRKLWKDPMTEDGMWALIFEGGNAPPAQGGDTGNPPENGEDGDPNGRPLTALGGTGEVTIGPIAGVRSRSTEESIKVFFGRQTHAEWHFTYVLFQGSQGFGVPGAAQPVLLPTRAQWIGRPFPPDLLPPGAGQPPQLPDPKAPALPNQPPPPRPGAGRGKTDGG